MAEPFADTRVGDAAKYEALLRKPAAYTALRAHDFTLPTERMNSKDLGAVTHELEKAHGAQARLALMAHFEPLTRSAEPDVAARARLVVDTVRNVDGWVGISIKDAMRE
jgi:hypothetical protein